MLIAYIHKSTMLLAYISSSHYTRNSCNILHKANKRKRKKHETSDFGRDRVPGAPSRSGSPGPASYRDDLQPWTHSSRTISSRGATARRPCEHPCSTTCPRMGRSESIQYTDAAPRTH